MGGLCSSLGSTVAPALRKRELDERRAALLKFRTKYKHICNNIRPKLDSVRLVCEVEPWIAAKEGTRGVDDALASFQRGSHASTAEINFALAGLKSVDNKYDYARSIVLSLADKKTNDCICAAFLVEHDNVLELIWFVTRRKEEGKGLGSSLFYCIREMALATGVNSLLVTSTPQATGFWLKFLFENPTWQYRTSVCRSQGLEKKINNTEKLGLAPRQVRVLKLMRAEEQGSVEHTKPPDDVRKYYLPYSGKFKGKPYRYGIDSCSHIWFRVGEKARRSNSSHSSSDPRSAARPNPALSHSISVPGDRPRKMERGSSSKRETSGKGKDPDEFKAGEMWDTVRADVKTGGRKSRGSRGKKIVK